MFSGRDETCTKHKRHKVSELGIVRASPRGPVKSQSRTGNNHRPWALVLGHCWDPQYNEYSTENILNLLIKILYFPIFEVVLGEFLTKEGSHFNERANGKYIE